MLLCQHLQNWNDKCSYANETSESWNYKYSSAVTRKYSESLNLKNSARQKVNSTMVQHEKK